MSDQERRNGDGNSARPDGRRRFDLNGEAEREELLISRVVDGEAGHADWAELESLAKRDARIWTQLAHAFRTEAVLRETVERRIACADRIALPLPAPCEPPLRSPRGIRFRGAGWAAALLIALLWGGVEAARWHGGRGQPGRAGERLAASDADHAWQRYLDAGRREGRLVGELPPVIQGTQPIPDSEAIAVYYVRRLVEKTMVDHFYDVGVDDLGTRKTIPVRFADVRPPSSL